MESLEGSMAVSEFEEAYQDAVEPREAIFEQPLGSVPRRELLVVPAFASVAEAIDLMNERHVGCVVVTSGERLVGIFTERDVLTKIAGLGNDPRETPLDAVMTRDPETLPESASIAYALRQMTDEGYRHVPLVDERYRPVGVVGLRDIVAWIVDLFPARLLNLPPVPGYPHDSDGG